MAFLQTSNPVSQRTDLPSQSPSARVRRKGKVSLQDDEFMAAAVGDLEWLKQALKKKAPTAPIEYDKNVCQPVRYNKPVKFYAIIQSLPKSSFHFAKHREITPLR